MMRADPQQIMFMRSIAGSPCTVFMALILFGQTMKNVDLQRVTGMSQETISTSLTTLQDLQLVQHNGRQYGWSLTAGAAKQLELFPNLLGTGTASLGSEPTQIEGIVASPDDRKSVKKPVDNSVDNSVENRAASLGTNPQPPTNIENFDIHEEANIENFDIEHRKFRHSDPATSHAHARVFTTTLTTTTTTHTKDSSSSKPPMNIENFDIRKLLASAGIGHNSKKMAELLNQLTDLEYVRAHVNHFLWEQEQHGNTNSVGLLIKRLQDNDAPPPLRCNEHLSLNPCILCQMKPNIRR